MTGDAQRRDWWTRADVVWPALLIAALIAVASVGQVQHDLFTRDDTDLVSVAFVLAAFCLPFGLVGIALLERTVGLAMAALSFAIGVAGLVVVPALVDRSIADDPSSTAGLVHLWDPVLVAIPIGCVLFLGWGARRIRQALHRG